MESHVYMNTLLFVMAGLPVLENLATVKLDQRGRGSQFRHNISRHLTDKSHRSSSNSKQKLTRGEKKNNMHTHTQDDELSRRQREIADSLTVAGLLCAKTSSSLFGEKECFRG